MTNLLRLADVDVHGKRVFIRADLNVPQDDAGRITDDTRIRASLTGIRDALARGGAVMVTSHLGRPIEGTLTDADSLAPIAERLGELLDREVRLIRDWVSGGVWHSALAPGDLVMLENCRVNPGEKKDSDELARQMARCATSTATTRSAPRTAPKRRRTAMARYAPVACAGPLLAAELDALGKALAHAEAPARRDRRGREGIDEADDPARARGESRHADRRRRHRQHVHRSRQAAGSASRWRSPTSCGEARAILDEFPGRVPIPVDAVCAKRFAGDATAVAEGDRRRRGRRPDSRHRAADDRDAGDR